MLWRSLGGEKRIDFIVNWEQVWMERGGTRWGREEQRESKGRDGWNGGGAFEGVCGSSMQWKICMALVRIPSNGGYRDKLIIFCNQIRFLVLGLGH